MDVHPTRKIQYSPQSHWLSLLLYILLINQGLALLGSYVSLAGSKKIYPRIFFGIFIAAIPFFGNFALACLTGAKSLYPRLRWDLVTAIFVGFMTWLLCVTLGMKHILTHGNEAGTMPFEVPNDLGSTFILAHGAIFTSSFINFFALFRAISGYALDGYPLSMYKEN
jgi:hypothetical protein